MKRFCIFIAAFGLLAACATDNRRRLARTPDLELITLTVQRDDVGQYFNIQVRSKANRAICIPYGAWPNSLGQIDMPPDDVFVDTPTGTFPATRSNFGYCVGDCDLRLAPFGSATGRINYSEFLGWSPGERDAVLRFRLYSRFCD